MIGREASFGYAVIERIDDEDEAVIGREASFGYARSAFYNYLRKL